MTIPEFKTRYRNHVCSFKNVGKRNDTTLSQHIWKLKDANIQHSVKWKIIARCHDYNPNTRICNLCVTEKYYILVNPHLASLNDRNELGTHCRHRKKYLICNSWLLLFVDMWQNIIDQSCHNFLSLLCCILRSEYPTVSHSVPSTLWDGNAYETVCKYKSMNI